jgi:hypothetical protein
VTVVSVTFLREQFYLPAGAGASDTVEHFARLQRRKAVLLSIVVQSIHDAFQDVER